MIVSKNYMRTAEVDVSAYFEAKPGEAVLTIREPSQELAIKLIESRDAVGKFNTIFSGALAVLIVEHNFTDDAGAPLTIPEVVRIVKESAGMYLFLQTEIMTRFFTQAVSQTTTSETSEN